MRESVNALNGLISFLPPTGEKKQRRDNCGCQCPKRANLISTLSVDYGPDYILGVSMP